MAKIISIHEYVLKPNIGERQFEQAVRKARQRGLFQLTGLLEYHFVKGIRGLRKGAYAAVWIDESREALGRSFGDHHIDHGPKKNIRRIGGCEKMRFLSRSWQRIWT
jgi:hypothetical protein